MPLESCIEAGILINSDLVEVWQALVDPEKVNQWVNGQEVELMWAMPESVSFNGGSVETPVGNLIKFFKVDPLQRLEYSCLTGSVDDSGQAMDLNAITVTVVPKVAGTYMHVKQTRQTAGRSLEIVCSSWSSKLIAFKNAVEQRGERRLAQASGELEAS